jgi:hypothetical protein
MVVMVKRQTALPARISGFQGDRVGASLYFYILPPNFIKSITTITISNICNAHINDLGVVMVI